MQLREAGIRARVLFTVVFLLAFGICLAAQTGKAQAVQETRLSGVQERFTVSTYRKALVDEVKVSPAYGRKVELYRYDTHAGRYVLERTFATANAKSAKVQVKYPSSWKARATTKWKIVAPAVAAKTKTVRTIVPSDDETSAEYVYSQQVVREPLARASVKTKVNCSFLTCRAAVVYDVSTGKAVYSYRPFAKRKIASLTKMMTATLLVERKSTTSRVRYTSQAVSTPYGYGFSLGDSLSVKDAVYAMMLPSSNDTATACAIAVSGSVGSFCKAMDKRARELGCRDTVYKNAHGLDKSGAHSTAYDQALIAANLLTSNKTKLVRKAARTRARTVHTAYGYSYRLRNTNKLLGSSYGVTGVKTGTEDDAGRCLACSFEAGGKTYVSVALGAYSDYGRYANAKRLISFTKYAASKGIAEYEL